MKKIYKDLEVIEYANNSYVSNLKNKKSIIKYYFFFGKVIITWYSKWQQTISISISKTEYIALSQGAKKGV